MKHIKKILILTIIIANSISAMENENPTNAVATLKDILINEGYSHFISKLFNYGPTQKIQSFINKTKSSERRMHKQEAVEVTGFTLLHNAVRKSNTDAIFILSEHGADLCAQDSSGRTPLDIAQEMKSETNSKKIKTRYTTIENLLLSTQKLEAKNLLAYQLKQNNCTFYQQQLLNWALSARNRTTEKEFSWLVYLGLRQHRQADQ